MAGMMLVVVAGGWSSGNAVHAKKGDVIQMHVSCYLEATGQLVESSRQNRQRPFEFVLGFQQVGKEQLAASGAASGGADGQAVVLLVWVVCAGGEGPGPVPGQGGRGLEEQGHRQAAIRLRRRR